MTIHKAKGLEFPTVIIPELDSTSTRKEAGVIYHSRLLPEDQIEVGISIKEGIESKKTNLLENIKNRIKENSRQRTSVSFTLLSHVPSTVLHCLQISRANQNIILGGMNMSPNPLDCHQAYFKKSGMP